MKPIALAGLLALALVSGGHPAYAQNNKPSVKSEDTAKQPSGPTIEQTQEFIAGVIADEDKTTRIKRKSGEVVSGGTYEDYTSYKLRFTGPCKAEYVRHHERAYDSSVLDMADSESDQTIQLNLKDQVSISIKGGNISFVSRKSIADIWREYVRITHYSDGDRKKTEYDKLDSLDLSMTFSGVYAEKMAKAFDHLGRECAKLSSAPAEPF